MIDPCRMNFDARNGTHHGVVIRRRADNQRVKKWIVSNRVVGVHGPRDQSVFSRDSVPFRVSTTPYKASKRKKRRPLFSNRIKFVNLIIPALTVSIRAENQDRTSSAIVGSTTMTLARRDVTGEKTRLM